MLQGDTEKEAESMLQDGERKQKTQGSIEWQD